MDTLTRLALRNAAATVAYVFAVAWFMQNAEQWLGPAPPQVLGVTAMILLFTISALVTGSLVLWRPAQLLIEGKKQEAGRLLTWTAAFLVVILAAVLIVLVLT